MTGPADPLPGPTGLPTDPAFAPQREEEATLLQPEASPDFALRLDLAGRLRKLADLVLAPRRLARTLCEAPDIVTPLVFLTLLGMLYMAAFGDRLQPMILADVERGLTGIPEEQLSAQQREGLPESISGLILWSVGAIGINHIVLAGVYAFGLFWLGRFLGYSPLGFPQWLSLMAFFWIPRPITTLGIDAWLILSGNYDSWNALKHDASNLYPGLHLLLPAQLDFTRFWPMAAYYLLGPADLFLLLALGGVFVAMPYAMERPEPRGRFVVVAGIIFVLIGAFALRAKTPPEQLREISIRVQAAERLNGE